MTLLSNDGQAHLLEATAKFEDRVPDKWLCQCCVIMCILADLEEIARVHQRFQERGTKGPVTEHGI